LMHVTIEDGANWHPWMDMSFTRSN
jgi:hypothetical protein